MRSSLGEWLQGGRQSIKCNSMVGEEEGMVKGGQAEGHHGCARR